MSGQRLPWRPIAFIAVIAVLFGLSLYFNVGGRIGEARDWIGSLGPWGPLVFGLIYVIAVVAAVPASALTIAAGALFGTVTGVILVSISATAGAGLAFLIARYVARESVQGWLAKNEKLARLDRMTEEHGAVIVALTRLVPIFPFNLLNYGFGLTRVRFWTYLFWSWLCMLPGTVLYVAGTDVVVRAVKDRKAPWPVIGAFVVALVLLVFLVRFAKGRIKEK
jgi:uncharacterized membrane protein YdjX (TVP38/TMEM64 family)